MTTPSAAAWVAVLCVFFGGTSLAKAAESAPAQIQSTAPSETLPDVVTRGLEGYARIGAEAAIRAWIAGGPLDSDAFAAPQISGLLRIEEFYGKYQGFGLIRAQDLTPRLKAVYLSLYFEKGAAFCYLLCYRTSAGGWVVGDFDGSTSPRRILPEYGAVALPIEVPDGAASEASRG